MKKTLVLVVLFILPLVAYLFFASGINQFGVLPTRTELIKELPENELGIQLSNHISILGFLGSDLEYKKANAFNLNQKIYKRFYEFNDFQFVMLVTKDAREVVSDIKRELSVLADVSRWHFVYLDSKDIEQLYAGLNIEETLDSNYSTDKVFIIDKQLRLRGREQEDEEHPSAGYDATSVADLTNVMIDDVKILLAEYRMALKKNSNRN